MTILVTMLVAAMLTAPDASPCSPHVATAAHADSSLVATFLRGESYDQFFAAVNSRKDGWVRLTGEARADSTLVERLNKVDGRWRLLAVAVDACNDSMNSLPFVAKLLSAVGHVELRIVSPEIGSAVQQSHRTLDGRAATPTFVLINEAGDDAGCIVELPRELRNWTHSLRTSGRLDSLQTGKRAFYERDKGQGITTEVVEMIEAASAGQVHCDSGKAD